METRPMDTQPDQDPAEKLPPVGAMDMILPTVGRVVHFRPMSNPKIVLAAIICRVWSDDNVNLMVIDENGAVSSRTSVTQGNKLDQWDWPARV